jgi:hypothetical protein
MEWQPSSGPGCVWMIREVQREKHHTHKNTVESVSDSLSHDQTDTGNSTRRSQTKPTCNSRRQHTGCRCRFTRDWCCKLTAKNLRRDIHQNQGGEHLCSQNKYFCNLCLSKSQRRLVARKLHTFWFGRQRLNIAGLRGGGEADPPRVDRNRNPW